MRIVGLPEFSGSVLRPSAAASSAGKISPTQKIASDAREAEAPISTSRVSAGRDVPVDSERVAEIRKALESGTYPLVPTKIADAMIAAELYGKIRA